MTGKSRSTLFLIEKLIVILVFALCSVACVEIFVSAYIASNDAKDLNYALVAAKNGAERYKAYDADMSETARSLGGVFSGADEGAVVVFYDEGWLVSGEQDAVYSMRLRPVGGTSASACELSISKVSGEEILSFMVAAQGR